MPARTLARSVVAALQGRHARKPVKRMTLSRPIPYHRGGRRNYAQTGRVEFGYGPRHAKNGTTRSTRAMPNGRGSAAVSRELVRAFRERVVTTASAVPPNTAPPLVNTGSWVLRATNAPEHTRSSVRRPKVSPTFSGALLDERGESFFGKKRSMGRDSRRPGYSP